MVDLYKSGLRPFLFSGLRADPEWLHRQTIAWLARLGSSVKPNDTLSPLGRWGQTQLQQRCCYQDTRLSQNLWGLSFENPVGLAAGFDKDGEAARAWASLGFGFAELGTVTWHPQPGNPPPRLFRLPQDHAALNRMGFNNQGAIAMANRLQPWRDQASASIPWGINLGKSKITPLEAAAADYCQSFAALRQLGDYFVVNVSSPNTPGLRSLQSRDQLEPILAALQQDNVDRKPLLVKIAPDLDWDAIAAVVDLAETYELAGIIATNTTLSRQGLRTQVIPKTGNPVTAEAGGISGAPLGDRATEIIRQIYRHTQGRLPIIGVGGIFTAEDAWAKITAGASLLQVYTGWVYEGPEMVRRILVGLGERLEVEGLEHVSQAVGRG